LPTTYVNPITGVELPIPPSRVLKKGETEPEEGVKQQKSQVETSKTSIVPSENELAKTRGPIPLRNVTNELADFNIISCVWLDDSSVGKCANCKDTGTLPYQVRNTKKEYGSVCKRCGELFLELIEKQRKVD